MIFDNGHSLLWTFSLHKSVFVSGTIPALLSRSISIDIVRINPSLQMRRREYPMHISPCTDKSCRCFIVTSRCLLPLRRHVPPARLPVCRRLSLPVCLYAPRCLGAPVSAAAHAGSFRQLPSVARSDYCLCRPVGAGRPACEHPPASVMSPRNRFSDGTMESVSGQQSMCRV